MKFKASGRAALMVAATLLFAGFQAAEAAPEKSTEKPAAAAPSKARSATKATKPAAPVRQKAASKPVRPKTAAPAAAANEAASDAGVAAEATSDALPLDLPPSVANANAQIAAGNDAGQTVFPDPAAAMAAKPDETGAVTPPAAAADIVASDQLNDVDLADAQPPAQPKPQPAIENKPTTGSAVQASSADSTWGHTSLIGKIFIAFGGLLTLASAARMFMA